MSGLTAALQLGFPLLHSKMVSASARSENLQWLPRAYSVEKLSYSAVGPNLAEQFSELLKF